MGSLYTSSTPTLKSRRGSRLSSTALRGKDGGTSKNGEIALAVLCALAIIVTQYLHAGVLRPVLAYPGYGLLILAGCGVALKMLQRKNRQLPFLPLAGAAAGLAWLAWHSFNARDPWSGHVAWSQALACLLMFLTVGFGLTSTKARLVFFALLFANGGAQLLLASQQFNGALGLAPQGWFSEQLRVWFENRSTNRVVGLYLNPNHFAWFLNMLSLFAASFAFWGRFPRLIRSGMALLAIAFMATALFTMSRGGFLALFAGYALFLVLSTVTYLRSSQKNKQGGLALLGLGLCMVPLISYTSFLQHLGGQASRMQSLFDDDYRAKLWPIAVQRIEESPLIGKGPGSFIYFARQHRSGATDDLYTHNDWLQITGDYGFVGLGLMVLFLIAILTGAWCAMKKIQSMMDHRLSLQSNRLAIIIGAKAALAAFLLHSYFDFNLQLPANALLAASCAGLLCGNVPPGNPNLRQRSLPLAACAASLSLLLALSLFLHRNEIAWLRGENAALLGDHDKARRISKLALAQGRPNARLYYMLGDMTLQSAKVRKEAEGQLVLLVEAEAALRKAASLLPQERLHHLRLAETLLFLARPEEGRAAALRGISLAPQRATGYELCGWSYEIENNLPSAIEWYQKAFSLADEKIARQRVAYLQTLSK